MGVGMMLGKILGIICLVALFGGLTFLQVKMIIGIVKAIKQKRNKKNNKEGK